MFKLFARFFDRIIFTITFIIGVQAPEFIQQYIQRLSGHLNEVKYQLVQFKGIAELQFNGDLSLLIRRYQTNSDTAIQQTGDVVAKMVERAESFEWQLQQLQDNNYIKKLYHFVTEVDLTMAKSTLDHYQLAIPLELGALATGVIFALTIVALQLLSLTTAKSCSNLIKHRMSQSKNKQKTKT